MELRPRSIESRSCISDRWRRFKAPPDLPPDRKSSRTRFLSRAAARRFSWSWKKKLARSERRTVAGGIAHHDFVIARVDDRSKRIVNPVVPQLSHLVESRFTTGRIRCVVGRLLTLSPVQSFGSYLRSFFMEAFGAPLARGGAPGH